MKPERIPFTSTFTQDDPEREYLVLNAEIETKRLQISRLSRQQQQLTEEVMRLEKQATSARQRAVALVAGK